MEHSTKTAFFCPHCTKITGTIDNIHLQALGICAECKVMYVDDRAELAIDLSKYSPLRGIFNGMSQEKIQEALSKAKNK